MKIYQGTGFVAYKTGASILPVYIKNTYRIATSRAPGRKKYFAPLTIIVGKLQPPMQLNHLAVRERRKEAARRIYQWLIEMRFQSMYRPATLAEEFIRICKKNRWRIAFKDPQGKISYGKALTGALLLGRYCSRIQERNVGILLPTLSVTAVLFMGLQLFGKVPALLNYAAGAGPLHHMMKLGDIETVITSREFLERIGLSEAVFAGKHLLFMEDIRAAITWKETMKALWQSMLSSHLSRTLPDDPGATAVILFTSGSEGLPKGVALSHENIITNIYQCLACMDINEDDYLLNALPIFHSFGLTVGTLLPLFAGAKAFLYINPLHYRVVPETVYDENCTVLLGTNTFLYGYARRADPYDFHTIRYIYCGAEALLDTVFSLYSKQFGKRILSGYGATECSPVISLNNELQFEYGTVGKLVPGMESKIVPVEGLDNKSGHVGLLYVRGKNVMQGYLKNDAANYAYHVIDNGWYNTGDIVEITAAGFVRIVGRQKRFAKVSGEMISLAAIEEALAYAIAERKDAAILAEPEQRHGERIILVTNDTALTLSDVRDILAIKGFSPLSYPREIIHLHTLPKLATGKIDYQQLRAVVSEERLSLK
jgi:acyl-[acyl-carrier-protein]-phospholipid O-acyltransferase/long-chain-fatty-acid--[acyl-carrier-protein] ligase